MKVARRARTSSASLCSPTVRMTAMQRSLRTVSEVLSGSSCSSSSYSSASSTSSSSSSSIRCLSTTAAVYGKPRRQRQVDDPLALKNLETFQYDDVPSGTHQYLARQREMLGYARVVQWEMPKLMCELRLTQRMQFIVTMSSNHLYSTFLLTAFRKPYKPPHEENILRFRSHHYQGEAHPSSRKSVLTVKVSDLFQSGRLNSSQAARRKLLLLAGCRWDTLGEEVMLDDVKELEKAALEKGVGQIKISCERFPEERMNLKWCSDTIDKLIEEANVSVLRIFST